MELYLEAVQFISMSLFDNITKNSATLEYAHSINLAYKATEEKELFLFCDNTGLIKYLNTWKLNKIFL